MRQRSASHQDNEDQSLGAARSRPQRDRPYPQKPALPPRISLPQHPAAVDSTLADLPEDTPRHSRTGSMAVSPFKPTPPALPAVTAPLDEQEPITNADFQIIPRTLPAIRRVRRRQRWYHTASPRMTLIKLALIGAVCFTVLGATIATAGGGKVAQLLFSSINNSAPYSPASSAVGSPVSKRVQPITQANEDAGYDSLQQHDIYWNAACSAATLTEILRAWGVQNVTIGHVIDEMSAHDPPYITPWGGLMSQAGWDYIAQLYHFQAKVQLNGSLSFNEIIRTTVLQGIPVVLGLRDNGGLYFPAFGGGGHFLVAVGGNSGGVRVVDSSLYRITDLPLDEFNYLWTGETVIITPA